MLTVRLRHRFPGPAAAQSLDIDFVAPTPGTTVLFGASGAGKSSVIAVIAGLLRPDFAHVMIGDAVLTDTPTRRWLPPERRRLGVVFQDARLFPHLGVAANLRYGQRRAPPGTIGFERVVSLLGLAGLLDRRPHTLSGGERQRVAIGRALLSQPRLLLMDEPLAGLDAARKAEILPYLSALQTELAIPLVYVTHALDEVVRLADHLVVLEAGRVAASGGLAELTHRSDLALAARDDAGAILSLTVAAHDAQRRLTLLERGSLRVWVPLLSRPANAPARIRIPAREIILATAAPAAISVQNVLSGTVLRVVEDPGRHLAMVEIAVGDDASTVLLARLTPDAVARLRLVPGVPVLTLVKSVAIEVLD